MANTLRFKRGLVSGIPTAALGEPLFTTDTFDLYIGNGTTNTRFQKYIASGTTSQLLRGDGSLLTMPIVLTSPSNGQVLKYNGTSWVNDSDSGITGSGAAGQVAYFTGTTTQTGSNNLFWDAINNRLRINTQFFASNEQTFNVYGSALFQQAIGDHNKIYIGNNTSLATADGILLITPNRIKLNTGLGTLTINADNLNIGAGISLNARNTDSGSLSLVSSGIETLKIFGATRNVLIQNGGTFTDSGQRLQVTGDTLMKGSGATSATTALTVQNSGGTNMLRAFNNGLLRFGSSGSGFTINPTSGPSYAIDLAGGNVNFSSGTTTQDCSFGRFLFSGSILSRISDNVVSVNIASVSTFAPPNGQITGNGRFVELLLQSTINQTGTAVGTTRGLHINPTLTSAPDWRSIEWSNNSGWGLYGAGSANNHLLGNTVIGSTTLLGVKFSVFGDSILRGSGNTSATTALTVQNSDAANIFRVLNNGVIGIGNSSDRPFIFPFTTSAGAPNLTGTNLGFYNYSSTQLATNGNFSFENTASAQTSGANSFIRLSNTFAPTSGTATQALLLIANTINQTGGANGITRGLYVVPTLTAAANWRSIEWSNNTGWGLYGAGTAANYLAGSLGIGTNATGNYNLRVTKNLTGSAIFYNVMSSGAIQSDVTTQAHYFRTGASSANATFTLPNLYHYTAVQDSFGASSTITNQYGFYASSSLIGATNNYGFFGDIAAATGRWNLYMNGTASNYFNGNLLIGSISDTGEKLQVSGTMKVTGASTFGDNSTISKNYNGETKLTISNTTSGDSSIAYISFVSSNGSLNIGKRSSTLGVYKFLAVNDSQIFNNTSGDIAILNDFASGSIKMAAGGSSTAQFTIASTGAATFSSTLTTGGNILIGATASTVGALNFIKTGTSPVASRLTFGTDGTGYSFAIGKNQAGTVTDFITISDSGLATFTSVQSAGINISGGNGYRVINSSSNTVTALRPTGGGSSVMSTNSNGLHIAVGTEANSDLILATNNTERLRLYRDGYLVHATATNPSASSTDAYLQYSADVVAGNAAPHFRTENGAVIKLYQETTGVGNAIISLGGGSSVLDDTTFDGYTLRQIVKALRNQGILQ